MEKFRTPGEIRKLFETLGIEHLSRPRFAWTPPRPLAPSDTAYYRDNREEFERLTGLYGDDIRGARLAPVYVARTERMGYGLFAAERLDGGEFVGEYAGIVDRAADVEVEEPSGAEPENGGTSGFPTDYAWGYPEWYEGVPLEIDAARAGNELRFVNHSFKPNLIVEHTVVDGRWAVFFVARKRIPADAQLFADYGMEYWAGGHRELVVE